MDATPIPKDDNQLWGIYYHDREYARVMGDPLRMVVEAPTKEAAENAASKAGLDYVWAHPLTPEQIQRLNATQPAVQTPTAEHIQTAIGVLEKLAKRIDDEAACTVDRLPDSKWADKYAERLEAKTIEETTSIKSVVAKLQNWREELSQQSRQSVSRHI